MINFDKIDLFGNSDVYFISPVPEVVKAQTLLYPLVPLKVGTIDCESLNNYFLRLADEHCVSPAALYQEVLSPLLMKHSLAWHHLDAWRLANVSGFNGFGLMSNAWIEVLTSATGICSLINCTLLKMKDTVSCEGLFAKAKNRYCPMCFKSEHSYRRHYKRLLWSMLPVTACPIHKIRLVSHVCDAPVHNILLPFKRKLMFGICSKCGSIGYRCQKSGVETASPVEIWYADQIASVIAYLPYVHEVFSRDLLIDGITKVATDFGNGKPLCGENRIGIRKSTLWGWINGKSKPRLDLLLNLCATANVSLLSLFLGKPEQSKAFGARASCRRPNTPSKISLNEKEAFLRKFLDGPPISVAAAAGYLKADRAQLIRDFPNLTAALTRRFREKNLAEREEKEAKLKRECQEVANRLSKIGFKISYKIIEKETRKVNMPRSRIRKIVDEILADEKTKKNKLEN